MLVPWTDLTRTLHNFDHMFRELDRTPAQDKLGVEEDEQGWTVTTLIPGVKREDVDVRIAGDRLVIETRRDLDIPDGYRVIRRERDSAHTTRSLLLGTEVDAENVEAKLKRGVLEIRLHRLPERTPRSIPIQID